jgi:hypothetical protein
MAVYAPGSRWTARCWRSHQPGNDKAYGAGQRLNTVRPPRLRHGAFARILLCTTGVAGAIDARCTELAWVSGWRFVRWQ